MSKTIEITSPRDYERRISDRRESARLMGYRIENLIRDLRSSSQYWIKAVNEEITRLDAKPDSSLACLFSWHARLEMCREVLMKLGEDVPEQCPCLRCERELGARS